MGAVRDRMLRELTNAVEALAAHDTLVLAIEDLHWSDPSTLDWISNVAPRMDPAKLLVIATLRPTNGADADGPLALLRESLRRATTGPRDRAHRAGDGGRGGVRPSDPSAGARPTLGLERLAERVHHHTGGNPLFMVTVLDQLVERGVVTEGADGWDTSDDIEDADLGIPDSIRPVIERQIARLSPIERRVLEAASVVGDTFDLAVVAEAAELDEDGAETALAQPGSRRFVRPSASGARATTGMLAQLEFVHALFRDALYGGIPGVVAPPSIAGSLLRGAGLGAASRRRSPRSWPSTSSSAATKPGGRTTCRSGRIRRGDGAHSVRHVATTSTRSSC